MSFHLYRINELYSNPSGTIQFIELAVGNATDQAFFAGISLTSTSTGVTRNFTFPGNLPSTATANTTVLIATQGFADLGVVTPNFIVPAGFLFPSGGTLDFGGVDVVSYAPLPADGVHSVGRSGEQGVATPKNFAGSTGALPAPTGTPMITGTAGDDTLNGTTAAEIIDGLGGDDTLRGGGGDDRLSGGSGDDVIHSGPGNDIIDGGPGFDYLYYTEAAAAVNINLLVSGAGGGAGDDTISGIELIFGSPFDDVFVGDDFSVGFLGGDGNDTITGGAGPDHLEGNGGDDVIDGLGGRDGVAYYSAASAVTVSLLAGTASGGLGNDTLRNIEDVTGSVFADTLTGDGNDNLLDGSDGDDTFFESLGRDTLIGGNGIDTVVYSGPRSAYQLREEPLGRHSTEFIGGSIRVAQLTDVERLRFSDRKVALDLDGHAGETAKVLGVVFGAGAVAVKEFVGIGLQILDGGTSYEQLAALAMQAAGKNRPADVVGLLWANLFGAAPTAGQAAPIVALLDGGMSIGTLTMLAAELPFNATNINLVGLAATGIEYA